MPLLVPWESRTMRLTKEQIVAQLEELREQLAVAHGEVKRVQSEIGTLQSRCGHTGAFSTSCMGEACVVCPDCGWSS